MLKENTFWYNFQVKLKSLKSSNYNILMRNGIAELYGTCGGDGEAAEQEQRDGGDSSHLHRHPHHMKKKEEQALSIIKVISCQSM